MMLTISKLVLFAVLLMTLAINSGANVSNDPVEELWEYFEVQNENIPNGGEHHTVPPRAWRRKKRSSQDFYSLDELVINEKAAKSFSKKQR